MNTKDPVRLLILEQSQNRAEELIVLLRTAGRATRAHQIESEADLARQISDQPWDLLLASGEANGMTAESVINQIRSAEKDIPIIMLADNRDPASITEGLKLGARDVALADDNERLILLIERELDNLAVRRAKRKADVELRETDRRNQLLLASSNAAIAYVHEGMHIYTNRAYVDLFGYEDEDELAGIPIIDLIANADQDKFKKFLKSYADNGGDSDEFTCVDVDGSNILTTLALSPATYDGESCTQVIFRQMVDDSELEHRIKEISSQDLLTGLFNRQYFIEALDTAVDQALEGKQNYVLFYIQIDHFSRVRSEAGISNSDLVLGEIASFIRNMVDDAHIMARFGDDVLALLFNGSEREEAAALAEQIRSGVEGHLCEVSGKNFQLTVSIGLTLVSESAPTSEEIISRAHLASEAVEDGNVVNFYQPKQVTVGDDGKALSSEHIKDLLKKALATNTLKLVFQPIISLHGEDEEQYEVLLRLIEDDGHELNPGQFMGAAEEAGLLEKIDRWVILQSIKRVARQRSSGGKGKVFINLSHKSISDETFLPWLSVAFKAAKLPSDAIILQIHENDATSYIKQATRFCKGLGQLHCKASINHFGCSLNPFNLLKHLTPDYVKLDGSFAQSIEDSEEKQQELAEMIKSLQATGVLTAISGVESPNVLALLWQTGLNYIQGYCLSEPLDEMDYDFSEDF
ncbi:MAG: EAL domain-containing protein [Proteobacteria bacterium]|jgi:diguanylate cyclase (GGDEF)-like protein/PAS domain S-box-containing protein|nr:EAL domain-containing protein [Pseudomonadota bacterium]MDA1301286.1 EAL domain-containing protein [Pseudomonadota bacterium]